MEKDSKRNYRCRRDDILRQKWNPNLTLAENARNTGFSDARAVSTAATRLGLPPIADHRRRKMPQEMSAGTLLRKYIHDRARIRELEALVGSSRRCPACMSLFKIESIDLIYEQRCGSCRSGAEPHESYDRSPFGSSGAMCADS
jgi:hypothetical protein